MSDIQFREHNKAHKGLKGLQNLGNTCYINAALQALAHIKPLRLYFTETYFRRLRLQWDNSIDALFCQFISSIWSSSHGHGPNQHENFSGSIDSLVILRAFVSFIWKRYPFFSPGDQHDSQEFLQCLLSDLHESLKIPFYPESQYIYNKSEYYPELKKLAEDLIEFDFINENNNVYYEKIGQFIEMNNISSYYSKDFKSIKSHMENNNIATSPIISFNDIQIGQEMNQNQGINSDLSEKRPIFFDSFNYQNNVPVMYQKLKYRSIISDLFAGELENTIRCVNCGKTSVLTETFLSLSIPISAIDRAIQSKMQNSMVFPLRLSVSFNTSQQKQQQSTSISLLGRSFNYVFEAAKYYYDYFWNWFDWFMSFLSSSSVDLIDCLETFFNPELLENENRYHCEDCKKLCNGVKCIRIKRLPEILIVHLNRYQNVNSMVRKISSQLNFPLIDFSLKSFLSESVSATLSDNAALYDLVAVICHSGTQVTNGHYICYALNEQNMEWFEFDDMHVSYVGKDRILSMASSAYILFYQRNDQQSLSTRALEIIYDIERHWIETCNDENYLKRLHLNLKDYYFFSTSSSYYKVAHDDAHVNMKSFILSKHWINSFLSLQNPGPIENSDIFCPHALIRPTEFLFFNNLSLPVIEPVGRFLWLIYGGGPLFDNNKSQQQSFSAVCSKCSMALDNFDKRRKDEYDEFLRLQSLHVYMFRKLKLKTSDISIIFEKCNEDIVEDLEVDLMSNNSDDKNENNAKTTNTEHNQNDEEEASSSIISPDGKTINLKILESISSDENSYYYLVSAEWLIKWLNFVNVRFDQPIVSARDRQLFSLFEQINKKRDQQSNSQPYEEIYRKKIHLPTNTIHPPLASLLRSINNTMNKNNYQIDSEMMLKQIDLNLHTILPPGPIDNWSIFGIKRKILNENKTRMNANKESNSQKWLTIDNVANYEELCSLFAELLSGIPLSSENKSCLYKFSFHSRFGGLYEENSCCVFYLMCGEYWNLFKDIYQGGPTITFNYLLNKFEANISVSDVEYFIREHYKGNVSYNEENDVDDAVEDEGEQEQDFFTDNQVAVEPNSNSEIESLITDQQDDDNDDYDYNDYNDQMILSSKCKKIESMINRGNVIRRRRPQHPDEKENVKQNEN